MSLPSNGNGNGRIKLEPTITLGSVIGIISMLAGLVMAWNNLAQGQTRAEGRLNSIEERMKNIEADHDTVTALKFQVQELFERYGKDAPPKEAGASP
jgi:hypothetical protein